MVSTTTSSSTGCESRSDDESSEIDGVSGSTMTSVELEPPESTAEEEQEEYMAYSLMLLSQGEPTKQSEPSSYVHLCKTCNRRFSHFRRSVGGQRAGHKKPKVHHEKCTKGLLKFVKEDDYMISRVHECWICGAEFSSGQALGAHMRRHRTSTTTTTTRAVGTNTEYLSSMKPPTVLQLDLNLPAPQEEQTTALFCIFFG
ncbi:hypothetical protein F3Y22_tig00020266pilonHSYRG00001 [Hibiscus syriacus]|uniref:C2H2-type domain-containing protein n=1 Tax=Hibiscus syriacus TaxID=106335 RepID=A0A6A3BZC8_HIBSY|nr:hypothetical protein F3Y22_tig00020266pilonHSYRG00001 [Hibiscus syriacus]